MTARDQQSGQTVSRAQAAGAGRYPLPAQSLSDESQARKRDNIALVCSALLLGFFILVPVVLVFVIRQFG